MARRQPRPPGVNCGRQLERVASSAALRAQATELERCPDTPGKRGAGIGGSSTSLFSAKHRILRFLLGGHPPAGAALGILPSSRPPCREPSRGSVRGFRAFGRFGHSEGTRTVTDGVSSCGGRSGRKIVPHRTTLTTRGSGIVPAHACGPPVRRAVPGLDARRSLRTEDRPTSDDCDHAWLRRRAGPRLRTSGPTCSAGPRCPAVAQDGRSSHIGHHSGIRGNICVASFCAICVEACSRPAAAASSGSDWPRSSRASSSSESVR